MHSTKQSPIIRNLCADSIAGNDPAVTYDRKYLNDIARDFEKSLHIRFRSRKLLLNALTHTSYSGKDGRMPDNERLEFLGDAVLNTVIAEYLFLRYPRKQEGELTKLRSAFVNELRLYKWARILRLNRYVLTSGGRFAGANRSQSVLSDALEAVVGALFLDRGFVRARRFVLSLVRLSPSVRYIDHKSYLQEKVQKIYRTLPRYVIVNRTGPAHETEFESAVSWNKKVWGRGKGRSKKEAEQRAAREAISRLRKKRTDKAIP